MKLDALVLVFKSTSILESSESNILLLGSDLQNM